MANAVKYWNGSSWQSPGYFGQVRMWNGSEWRMVEVKYAGGAGSGSWNVPAGLLDYQTVTVSGYEIIDYEIGYYENGYGYSSSYPYGSISDGTSNIYGGGAITDLNYVQYGSSSASVALGISGATNSGWTTMTIGTTSFSRASAATYGSGFWTWNVAVGANPFGTSGSKAVYWT